ncbi:hypothetical protein NC651_025445 [Populus alba x Populus x berolinensis]|nr:hypothetical protein NC651_025445 [Populus alba x Populus x berolinensis]
MTLQKSCASKHILRRSSPTPPPLQKPHHHPKRSRFNLFNGSFSPILRSRLESFLSPCTWAVSRLVVAGRWQWKRRQRGK